MCAPVTALASGVARGPGRRAERACCAFLIVSIMFMLPPPPSLPPPPKSILGATDRDACVRGRGTATNAWLVAKTATRAIVVSLATMCELAGPPGVMRRQLQRTLPPFHRVIK